MKPKTIKVSEGAYILYDEAIAGKVEPHWFDADYWVESKRLIAEAGGRGSSLIVEYDGKKWVLRQFRRGGLRARFGTRDYLWNGLEQTRPWREWRLLASMVEQGLPVARPVAAQVRKRGLFYQAALITEYIEGSSALSGVLRKGPLSEPLWCRLGACLYRFHHANIYHADLNAHNILLKDEDYYLIDFDRGARRMGDHWRRQTLERLRRSLHKLKAQGETFHFSEDDWQALLSGYARASVLFGDKCQ